MFFKKVVLVKHSQATIVKKHGWVKTYLVGGFNPSEKY